VTRPLGYRLRVEPGELDLERFETLLSRARSLRASGDVPAARACLVDALSMFTGAPLQDLTHVPFAPGEIGRLEELRLGALELRLEADRLSGRHAEVIGELEALVARFPFWEVLWGDLMLALYRGGRQGDALMGFDRARRILSDELGVDAGQALQELHGRILQQDPSLELAPTRSRHDIVASSATQSSQHTRMDGVVSGRPSTASRTEVEPPSLGAAEGGKRHPRRLLPGRRRLLVGVSGAVALALLAILIPRVVGGGGTPSGGFRPGTVLIDLETGKEVRSIPPAELAVSAYPIFAGGHFWVNNWSPSAYVEIDPSTGAIPKQISPPARDPNVQRDFATVTPFTVRGNTLWVTSGDDLVKMDIALGREVDRFDLDGFGHGFGLAEGVAVGGGSVWLSRDMGRGQVLRLNPVTGTVEHLWNDVTRT